MRTPFSRASIVRIVCDLLAAEVAASRGRPARFDEATRFDADGIDLDSLERLNASAALNEFFHLHEYGAEDYLLTLATVGEWCDLVEQSLAATGTHLTFRTSGSTGEPRRCTHAIADLRVEVDHWARTFGAVDHVIGLVPSHHIYGTIFTALLPDALACAVEVGGGATAVGQAGPGTLVVGTPTQWAYLSRSLLAFPPGVVGTTSTAPMASHLAHHLRGQRLERLVEIYGSSETGGVASRDGPQTPFALLDHWTRDGDVRVVRQSTAGETLALDLPDEAQWLDDRRFAIVGRRDGAVQIGGHNVFPERVREQLLGHAGIADAAVRLEPATGRLKAFIVPASGSAETLVDDVDVWCGTRLRAHERPRRFAVGDALPRNAMGKLADW